MSSSTHASVKDATLRRIAGCSASRSLRKALKDAFAIVCMEFSLHGDTQPLEVACDCSSLRKAWEGMWSNLQDQKSNRRTKKRLASALKSTRRLFDRECVSCDEEMKEEEKNKWLSHMKERTVTKPSRWAPDPLGMLAHHIRELLNGWKENTEAEIGEVEYCPDQQGCFEVKQGKGGTLACPSERESTDYSLLRLGVAKTKGKARVVTMQPARVKRILSKVHNSLYNHLSKDGYLVRGDFKKEDAEEVIADRRSGELFTSGDYSSATNELHQDAVKTVVAEICNSSAVSNDEKVVLWQSFQRLRVETCQGIKEVNRGSMMGNLVSFPLLCLINKACYDITCDIMHGPFSRRKGKFNGDDCLFNSDQRFYDLWVEVTSTFGLVVNHEKTGRSKRWLELNSHTYDAVARRFVAKPVLSFLLRERDSKECLLSQAIEGMASFKNSVKEYVISVLLRREISLREINIQTLPIKWLKHLIAKSWFRNALARGPVPLKRIGVERKVEMVVDKPPHSRYYTLIDRLNRDVRSDYIERWKGVSVRPMSESLVKTNIRDWIDQKKVATEPLYRLTFGPSVWRFVWSKEVLNFLKREGYYDRVILSDEECESLWLDDHPSLKIQNTHSWAISQRLFPQPQTLSFQDEFPLGYR